MLNVQIFGLKNSQATRAAERFFKERRVTFQLVDLKQKPMAPAEIRRFTERFGLAGLLDSEGNAYIDAGLNIFKSPIPKCWSGSARSQIAPVTDGSRRRPAQHRSRRGVVERNDYLHCALIL